MVEEGKIIRWSQYLFIYFVHHSDKIIHSSVVCSSFSLSSKSNLIQLLFSGRSETTRLPLFPYIFELRILNTSFNPPTSSSIIFSNPSIKPCRYIQAEYDLDHRSNLYPISNDTSVKMPSLRAFVLGLAFALLALIQLSAATPVPAVAAADCTTLPSKVAATSTPVLPLSGGTYLHAHAPHPVNSPNTQLIHNKQTQPNYPPHPR